MTETYHINKDSIKIFSSIEEKKRKTEIRPPKKNKKY